MTSEQSRRGGPIGRFRDAPEEVLFFARLAAYGLGMGIGYWFLTYESVGSVLLTAMGGTAALLSALLARGRRKPSRGSRGAQAALEPDGPFGDEHGRLPAPTLAPLEVGLGIAIASLSFAFGAWMAIAAVVPIVGGTVSWLRGAEREFRAVEADDAASTPGR